MRGQPGVRVQLTGACASALLFLASLVTARAQPVRLTVSQGRCDFVVPTSDPTAQFFLLIGSLSESTAPTRVVIGTEACAGPAALPLAEPDAQADWPRRLAELQRAGLPSARPKTVATRTTDAPATRTFYIFTGHQDLENPTHYEAVVADLQPGLGRHCQVYVDRADRAVPTLDATVAEVIRVFDEHVHPWAEQHLGQTDDVDGDGRFTILLSRCLNRLQSGRTRLDGFVRGSDFLPGVERPFSNRCDMLYLNAELAPGPHLRTVLAHEYTHAVLFSERVRSSGRDEDSWLHEGLAHLVEDRHGFSASNLDYRLSAYLAAPERYPLVVPDYFGAGVWRLPGLRGAAFHFLRSAASPGHARLCRQLVHSSLHGVPNVERATGQPFAALFRQATLDLLSRKNYGFYEDASQGVHSAAGLKEQRGMLLCGPRFHETPLDRGHTEMQLAGTAAGVVLLHTPSGSHARICIEGSRNVPLQVTLVPLPTRSARLQMALKPGRDGVRLVCTAHGRPIRLRGIAWSTVGTEDRPLDVLLPRSLFACDLLHIGETQCSSPLYLGPGAQAKEIALRAWGEDEEGTPLGAWLSVSAADFPGLRAKR